MHQRSIYLSFIGKDGVRFLWIKAFEDECLQVIFNHLLNLLDINTLKKSMTSYQKSLLILWLRALCILVAVMYEAEKYMLMHEGTSESSGFFTELGSWVVTLSTFHSGSSRRRPAHHKNKRQSLLLWGTRCVLNSCFFKNTYANVEPTVSFHQRC